MDTRAPAQGRQFCEDAVHAWWADPPDDLDLDAVLVASELITNAFEARAGAITLELTGADDRLRVAVVDDVPAHPDLHDPATFGRGLTIVARLRARWGVEPRPQGKAVWVELAVDAASGAGAPLRVAD